MLNLVIERGKVWNIEDLPNKSIALDGAIMGPFIDNHNKKYSFDHHGNCIRHISSATCVQVLDAILLGFNPDGYNLYVNDVDHDTVIAAGLLLNPELAKNLQAQEITRIVGLVDAHGPSYPLENSKQKLFDIFNHCVMDSFNESKRNKSYSEYNLEELLFDCINKFKLMLEGKYNDFELKEPEIHYEITPKTNSDWIMVRSSSHVFKELYEKDYNKVILWEKMKDNSYSYTIGKKSEFIDFPIPNILKKLNEKEAGWGGGSTIGGAPRNSDGSRSKLTPEEVLDCVKSFLR